MVQRFVINVLTRRRALDSYSSGGAQLRLFGAMAMSQARRSIHLATARLFFVGEPPVRKDTSSFDYPPAPGFARSVIFLCLRSELT